jgi:hypothetical protein
MFGLVVVHDEAGVNDAGNPAEQRQRDTQEEAENAARHQDGNGRKDNAKEVAQGFQGVSSPTLRIRSQLARTGHVDRGVCLFQSSGWIRFASLPQFFLGVNALGRVGLRLGGRRRVRRTAGKEHAANRQETESKIVNLHQFLIRVP